MTSSLWASLSLPICKMTHLNKISNLLLSDPKSTQLPLIGTVVQEALPHN